MPLVARVAANGPSGPTVRPVWFLFEHGTLWWLTGSYSKLERLLDQDSRVAIVIDTCDVQSGQVLAVSATGTAQVHPLDADRAIRKLSKYLGDRIDRWPAHFRSTLEDPTAKMVSLKPDRPLKLRDLSYAPE